MPFPTGTVLPSPVRRAENGPATEAKADDEQRRAAAAPD
jgi:hypothetical protein